jgi:hypothetical protein
MVARLRASVGRCRVPSAGAAGCLETSDVGDMGPSAYHRALTSLGRWVECGRFARSRAIPGVLGARGRLGWKLAHRLVWDGGKTQ